MVRFLLVLSLLLVAQPAAALDDRELYENIVERVAQGENYYAAAADELRKGGYPLKPTLAFRPPTLAVVQATLPNTLVRFVLLLALVVAAVFAWMRMLADRSAKERVVTITLLMCGLANVGAPNSIYLHEAWAICFITLSLAFHRNLALCLLFAFVAILIRETAILFPIAMGIVALLQRDWRRAGWLVGLGLSSAALWLLHGMAAAQVVTSADPASPGWLALGGPAQILKASKWNLLTSQLGGIWLGLAVLLMAIGLGMVQRLELRIAALFVALSSITLLFFGRPDNDYWGIMFSPFLALGLPSLAKFGSEKLRLIRANSKP
jgi:hypothetical protein